jgi:hypothetical protein
MLLHVTPRIDGEPVGSIDDPILRHTFELMRDAALQRVGDMVCSADNEPPIIVVSLSSLPDRPSGYSVLACCPEFLQMVEAKLLLRK